MRLETRYRRMNDIFRARQVEIYSLFEMGINVTTFKCLSYDLLISLVIKNYIIYFNITFLLVINTKNLSKHNTKEKSIDTSYMDPTHFPHIKKLLLLTT